MVRTLLGGLFSSALLLLLQEQIAEAGIVRVNEPVVPARFEGATSLLTAAAPSQGERGGAPRQRRRLADMQRTISDCKFYPEIVLVQDVSESYKEALETLRSLMPTFFDHLVTQFDGKVKFGVTEFVDKGHKRWGFEADKDGPADYCAKIRSPIRAIDEEGAVDDIQKSIGEMRSGGGVDWVEGAGIGSYRTALSNDVGWSTDEETEGRNIVRVMIVATDATFHEPGKYPADDPNLVLAENDLYLRPEALDGDINAECLTLDFPTGEAMAAAFKSRNIFPIFLAGSSYGGDDGVHGPVPLRDLYDKDHWYGSEWEMKDLKYGIVNYYTWVLKEFMKIDGGSYFMDRATTEFIEIVDEALADVVDYVCETTNDGDSGSSLNDGDSGSSLNDDDDNGSSLNDGDDNGSSLNDGDSGSSLNDGDDNGSSLNDGDDNGSSLNDGDSGSSLNDGDSGSSLNDGDSGSSLNDGDSGSSLNDDDTSSSSLNDEETGSKGDDNIVDDNNPPTGVVTTTSTTPPKGGNGGGGGGGESTTTTTTTPAESKGAPIAAIAGAAGGAAALGLLGAGLFGAKKFGVIGGGNSTPDIGASQDAVHVNSPQEREQFEGITGELFA